MKIKSLGILFISYCFGFQIGNSQSDYLKISLDISNYLEEVKLETDDLASWPVMPEDSEFTSYSLYSGIPGVVLFYLELYNATADVEYINIAKEGAQYLIKALPDTFPGHHQLGLYTGAAGIAYTLESVYNVTGEELFLTGTQDWMEHIFQDVNSNSDDDFGNITDIVYGAAGIGLTAISLLENGNQPKLISLIRHCADFLVESSHVINDTVRWKMNPDIPYFMDNFSHGTAGNAFFLLRAYQITKDPQYKSLGLKAASYLHDASGVSGMVCHHQPGGEDLYYLSWCHGPPGTSRLFAEAFKLTGQEKYLNRIIASAESMIQLNLHNNNTPGFWNNFGWCCGSVGVADFYWYVHGITGDPRMEDAALKMEASILKNANNLRGGIAWKHAENRRSPDQEYIQTGLMQGSAGFGLYFIRRHLKSLERQHIIRLPDEIE